MDQHRLIRMMEATRLTRQGRAAEALALLQQGPAGGGALADVQTLLSSHLPDVRTLLSRLPGVQAPLSNLPDVQTPLSHLPGAPALVKPRLGPADPGRFLDLSFANAAGERSYKLYVPTGYAGQAVPLIVMLHGGTQSADDFAAGTGMNAMAERDTFLVAYPEQSRGANPMGYWNWFQPADQRRGSGEASLIAGITEEIIDRYAVDADRVYVAGFSAGGAMAAVVAAAYPDLYAAAGVHSGLPAGAAHDVPSAFAAMRQGPSAHRSGPAPLIVFHGDGDPTVNHVNAECLTRAGLRTAGPRTAEGHRQALTTRDRVPGGHEYTRRVYSDRDGTPVLEQWTIHQAGHAWSGGTPYGTYTDPQGPSASAELVRFFAQQANRSGREQAA
jgi:poly(hydroxyalkanoate) depolymerase family esterase